MALPCYLAMTAAEIAANSVLPPRMAWMACHFSPSGPGLTNLPSALPPGAILILDDSVPICDHKPEKIVQELKKLLNCFDISSVLLDFQRPDNPAATAVVQSIVSNLPGPVGVSELYAQDLDCPVFLSPPPPHCLLDKYLAPWQGRNIFLEAALSCETVTITDKGVLFTSDPLEKALKDGHSDNSLHCHYTVETSENQIRFFLYRTRDDLNQLLQEAEHFGVSRAIGLYQELNNI